MNALRQQFESQDAMVPGYVIQQQLDETGQRLVKAQAQQARIEAMVEKKGVAKKAPASRALSPDPSNVTPIERASDISLGIAIHWSLAARQSSSLPERPRGITPA